MAEPGEMSDERVESKVENEVGLIMMLRRESTATQKVEFYSKSIAT